MENRIPLPTDNIFKFYALFGLLTLVFSFGSVIYLTKSTNELLFTAVVELETLKALPHPAPVDEVRKQVLQRKIEIASDDKKTLQAGCSILAGLSVLGMVYGFRKWHSEIQPVQDELARLQVRKLQAEVARLESAPEERWSDQQQKQPTPLSDVAGTC
ncbi:hypothetical protein KTE26_14450 [Ralstonia mannitolilytica]|uniref:hypothetical protein n=1 Tax=Ralstonia mannitolilytica TaxID=105219 RepID=UPI0018F83C35|nr:hypothetical protein [Ralstonia mannitolilytica]MBU9579631.1 hypothetical protein [Ralstonia mannitolilytica]